MVAIFATVSALLLGGCAPHPGPDDWTLEPLAFETGLRDHPGVAAQQGGPGERVDLAFGFHLLAADGSGGFWAVSGDAWLHLSAGGDTLARFNAEPDAPLSRITAIAALSDTELVVVRDDGAPILAVLDTTTMTMRDIPGEAPTGSGADADFGDFAFGDLATRSGDAVVISYLPGTREHIGYEVMRVDLEDGSRAVLFRDQLPWEDTTADPSGLPPVDVDADGSGAIYIATPSAQIVLEPDGAVRSRAPQPAAHPHVAVNDDGRALWWGGVKGAHSAAIVVGGSAQARGAIAQRTDCGSDLMRRDRLTLSGGDREHPLGFLCGANAAAWTGSSWVVAIGGEGDGVLVRLSAPG